MKSISASGILSQVKADYSLRKLAYLLENYAPPSAAGFISTGKWRQDYIMFLVQPTVTRAVGRFSIDRVSRGPDNFVLTVRTQRVGSSGYSQFQHAEMHCRTDLLSSPVSWLFDTKMALTPEDKPYLLSGRRYSASVKNGTLLIRDNLRTSRTAINGLYSNEWTLLEAVQRLPRHSSVSIDYTLIDEYDTPQPGHRLAYRTRAKVNLQSGPEDLIAYYDVGHAVVPTVYWIDTHDRLLFVCTGLMVYALTATNGQPGICPEHYPSDRLEASPLSKQD